MSTVQSEVVVSAQAGHGASSSSSSAANLEGNLLTATTLHAHPAPQAAPPIQSTFRRLPSGLLGMSPYKAMQVHELGRLSLHLSLVYHWKAPGSTKSLGRVAAEVLPLMDLHLDCPLIMS